eukprot:Rmarinus@m.5253
MSKEGVDKLLDTIGLCSIHWRLLIIVGWGNAVDAVNIVSISYILSRLQVEWGLSDVQSGLLSSIVFCGMLVGGVIFGMLADSVGRRPVMLITLLLEGTFSLLSAGSPSFFVLLILRFFFRNWSRWFMSSRFHVLV